MKTIAALLTTLIILGFNLSSAVAEGGVLASGSLTGSFSSWGSPSLQGGWTILQTEDKTYLELDESFKAKEGPDVKVFLSPLSSDQINGENAAEDSIFVALLTEFKGKIRIEIPTGTDLSQYQSLVFHCEAYSKLWGTSPL